VSQFECPSHKKKSPAANQKHPKPKDIQLTILILLCLSALVSPARDAGGFSEILKCRILSANEKQPIAPIAEIIVGKLSLNDVCSFLSLRAPQFPP
jgi:hypothetical protein